jgi:hypothetical protein
LLQQTPPQGLPAALTRLVGSQTVCVALAKCVTTALLSTGFLAARSLDAQLTKVGLVILFGLYFGPQTLKHAPPWTTRSADRSVALPCESPLLSAEADAHHLCRTLTASSSWNGENLYRGYNSVQPCALVLLIAGAFLAILYCSVAAPSRSPPAA